MINPLHHLPGEQATIGRIRLMLGEQTALALAVLVAADVVDTVIKPSHAYDIPHVIKMGFVTILRTGLAYFLAHEMRELEDSHNAKEAGITVPIGHMRKRASHILLKRSSSSSSKLDSAHAASGTTTTSVDGSMTDSAHTSDSGTDDFPRGMSYEEDKGDKSKDRAVQQRQRREDTAASSQ